MNVCNICYGVSNALKNLIKKDLCGLVVSQIHFLPAFENSQLVSLPPFWIFNKFLFSIAMLNTRHLNKVIDWLIDWLIDRSIDLFIHSFVRSFIYLLLFSFASLRRIENISIISRRDKKHNKLRREPPAMIEFIYKSLSRDTLNTSYKPRNISKSHTL